MFVSQQINALCHLDHRISILRCNRCEDIEGVDPNVDHIVRQSDKCIVEEYIEPLLIELVLLAQHMGLASVDELITLKVFLQLLDNFDSHLQVMSTVSEDQLTDLLTLVGTLLDQRAIVPEEMLGEKFVEVVLRGVLVFIDLDSELLAEHECVGEGAFNRGQSAKHHGHESVESGQVSPRLEQSCNDYLYLLCIGHKTENVSKNSTWMSKSVERTYV